MRFKFSAFLLIFVLLPAGWLYSESEERARSGFREGNAFYSEEKFEEAVLAYEKAVATGFESGAIYYNLGNAYFKRGALGKAILNYLRAKKLMPEDPDLRSNLNYARSLVKGGRAEPGGNWLGRVFFSLAGSFSLDRLAIISAIIYFMLAASLILTIKRKNLRASLLYLNVTLSAILVIFASFFAAEYHKEFFRTEAVVTAAQTDCKFEPFIGATTFFTLHEGETASLIASEKDWLKVRRPDGKQGWVKRPDLELL